MHTVYFFTEKNCDGKNFEKNNKESDLKLDEIQFENLL